MTRSDSPAGALTRRRVLAAGGRIALLSVLPAALAACGAPMRRQSLDALQLRLDGALVPYMEVVGPRRRGGVTTTDLPLPERAISLSRLPARLAPLTRFDQGGTGRMLRDEVALAWALLIAEARTGRRLAPDALHADSGAGPRALAALDLSVAERKTLLAILQSIPELERLRRTAEHNFRRADRFSDERDDDRPIILPRR